MKVSDWYNPNQLPLRNGAYERLERGEVYMSYWNGNHWGSLMRCYCGTCEAYSRENASFQQNLPWRGLTK